MTEWTIEDYEAHEALLAAGAVHIKITLGTGWNGGKPIFHSPAEEEFDRLLRELQAEILLEDPDWKPFSLEDPDWNREEQG